MQFAAEMMHLGRSAMVTKGRSLCSNASTHLGTHNLLFTPGTHQSIKTRHGPLRGTVSLSQDFEISTTMLRTPQLRHHIWPELYVARTLNTITTGYRQYYTTQYVHISSLTFLLWDYVATFPDEVLLFWTGKWSYPRVLFFLNRYQVIVWQLFHTVGVFMSSRPQKLYVTTLRLVISQLIKHVSLARLASSQGQVWVHNLITFSALAMIIPVQLILSLRVYGLYNRAKWIAGFLAVLILASSAAELYVVIKLSPEMTRIALPFSDIIACEPTPGAVSHLYLGLIPAIAFDTPAFLLVLLRGVSHLRTQKNVGFRGSNLVRLLMRDSILYFLVILVVYIALAVSWIKLPGVEAFITFGYGFSIVSVTASRMLINLKKL
ncbi:hypothetical protein AB1N83_003532 [Pleurotus pulmonarius]